MRFLPIYCMTISSKMGGFPDFFRIFRHRAVRYGLTGVGVALDALPRASLA